MMNNAAPMLEGPHPNLSEHRPRWPGSQRLSYRPLLPLVVQQLWSHWQPPNHNKHGNKVSYHRNAYTVHRRPSTRPWLLDHAILFTVVKD